MTIGREPKPIRTGVITYSLCVTPGPLRTYKLFVRAYEGKSDEDLKIRYYDIATLQKWVNVYDIMLDNFNEEGHCVAMDSAYMSIDWMSGMEDQHGRDSTREQNWS